MSLKHLVLEHQEAMGLFDKMASLYWRNISCLPLLKRRKWYKRDIYFQDQRNLSNFIRVALKFVGQTIALTCNIACTNVRSTVLRFLVNNLIHINMLNNYALERYILLERGRRGFGVSLQIIDVLKLIKNWYVTVKTDNSRSGVHEV